MGPEPIRKHTDGGERGDKRLEYGNTCREVPALLGVQIIEPDKASSLFGDISLGPI